MHLAISCPRHKASPSLSVRGEGWAATASPGTGSPLLDLPGRFGQRRQPAQILPPPGGEVVRWVGRPIPLVRRVGGTEPISPLGGRKQVRGESPDAAGAAISGTRRLDLQERARPRLKGPRQPAVRRGGRGSGDRQTTGDPRRRHRQPPCGGTRIEPPEVERRRRSGPGATAPVPPRTGHAKNQLVRGFSLSTHGRV